MITEVRTHLVAAYGTTIVADLDAAQWFADPCVTGGITYDGSTVVLPDAPGLGVTGVRESAVSVAGEQS
jgi:L-alanine-DL-glutamate epimerase-like enolase superfamily enzyme